MSFFTVIRRSFTTAFTIVLVLVATEVGRLHERAGTQLAHYYYATAVLLCALLVLGTWRREGR